ncbi:MAG: hypothetical protein Q9164_000062 [Protoblastenia rupestris]
MYDAFGWKPPIYAHVGLLQDSHGQKLSKRAGNNDLRIGSYAESGVFPEALVNFVALLGWSHRSTVDFLRVKDLIQCFDLKFTKGNSKVEPGKLMYLQKRYAQLYVEERGEEHKGLVEAVVDVALRHLRANPQARIRRDDELEPLVDALLTMEAHFYTTPQEFFDRYAVLFCAMPREEWRARPTDRLSLGDIEFVQIQIGKICQEEWTTDRLREAIGQLTKHFDEKHTACGGQTAEVALAHP